MLPNLFQKINITLIAVIDIVRLLLLLLSCFSPPTLCHPMDGSPPGSAIPGILQVRTRVDCHFLLQCMKVKSENEVAQSCPTLPDPMDCSLLGSSIHGSFQARVLEWDAIAFSIVRLESYKPKFLIKIDKIYSQQNINELNPVGHTQGKISDQVRCFNISKLTKFIYQINKLKKKNRFQQMPQNYLTAFNIQS